MNNFIRKTTKLRNNHEYYSGRESFCFGTDRLIFNETVHGSNDQNAKEIRFQDTPGGQKKIEQWIRMGMTHEEIKEKIPSYEPPEQKYDKNNPQPGTKEWFYKNQNRESIIKSETREFNTTVDGLAQESIDRAKKNTPNSTETTNPFTGLWGKFTNGVIGLSEDYKNQYNKKQSTK